MQPASRVVLTDQVLSLDSTFPEEFPEAPVTGRPVNFGVVVPGVYQSSYPQREDYAYLETLKLKTLVYVSLTTAHKARS